MSLNLNEFAKDVHANADEHGWWDEERSSGEILALIHSEWSEALEEYRDGRPMVWHECVDDSVPEIHICENCPQGLHKVGGHSVQDCMEYGKKPEGIAVELLDGVIRIFDMLGAIDATMEDEETIDDMLSKMPEGQEKDCECKLPEFVTRLHALTSEAYFAENAEEMVTILLTAVAMVFCWSRKQGLDPEKIMLEKHEYNKTRAYKHGNKLC